MNQKTADDYSSITPKIKELSQLCMDNSGIDKELYVKYHVYRGLRDLDGNGVLTGLTEISDIVSSKMQDGQKISCEGELYYRGISIQDIVKGFISEKRYGFEEVTYLLLFGNLPHARRIAGIQRGAGILPHSSYRLCTGYYYESAQQRYDEHLSALRADHVFL